MNSDTERSAYRKFYAQTTRWQDNDVYGHINNVVYYSYFDSAANRYLIEECGLDFELSAEVGFVVASSCEYIKPISYPSDLEVGLRVNKFGHKSVEYGLAIFVKGAIKAAAIGCFTHVFVNKKSGESVLIPPIFRKKLELIENWQRQMSC